MPVAILAVGYWLLAPLLAPAVAPAVPPVAEAPDKPAVAAPTQQAGKTLPALVASTPAATVRGQPTAAATSTAAPTATPAPVASPTPGVYRASPVENLKIEPRAVEVVRLGRIEQGTRVRMSLSVRFNVGISNLSGVPDVDVQVIGPTGTVVNRPNARDATVIELEAPATGEYELRLDNTRSRVNAKRVTVQFG